MGDLDTGAGKGDTPRPTNLKKYGSCPLWKNLKKSKREREKGKKNGKK